ncbi:DUF2207 domain-containing protein [Carnobacterium pleistocenium]|uniref:DUF2207 domain-containing protein n=1 Tax=Carnobacterium pleistocenium TaxID=181073 RepID=UPI0005569A90|nr:DUF2207 domain-containing protein [Carnobacterium pleistocenium]
MNKKVKGLMAIGAAFLFSTVFEETVFAENELSDITIEVELQEDGSGVVTEHRKMNMDDGTELYIVLDDLQDSKLLGFSVAGFQKMDPWQLDASLEEKANYYGTVGTDDGLELIWGIGEYGENDYEVTYALSNLVRELEDGQGLLWNFDTFSDIPAEDLTVEITGFEPFTEENVRFWGFGFEGDMQLEGNTIVWRAEEEVDNSKDVTVLLQFPQGIYTTQASVGMTSEEQREMAMNGSAYNDEASSNTIPIIIVSLIAVFGGGATVFGVMYYKKLKQAREEAGQMRTGPERIKENKKVLLEEIPYQGKDFAGIAYLLQEIDKGYFEDYFSAYLLKWSYEKRIMIHTAEDKSLFSNDFDTEIEILHFEEERARYPQSFRDYIAHLETNKETYETGLWLMLLDASNGNGFIEDTNMKKWARKYAKEVGKFADYLLDYSKEYLEKENLISFGKVDVWGAKHDVAVASPEGDKLFDRLVQFDNYLEEIDLKGFANNTNPFTFEEFLFWNTLYFRSEEITDEFKEMIPSPNDVAGDNSFIYYYWYWNGMTGFRQNWSSGLASGGFHSNASSATSGTGGSTSFGGGGGAGGGGGGGAR